MRTQSWKRVVRLAGVATLAALFVASGARAQNLIPNSSFSSLFALEGWPIVFGTTWSSIDSEEVPNSGSARVVNATPASAQGIGSVCLPIEAETNYRVSASALWLDAESSATGSVHLRVEFFHDGNCEDFGYAAGSGLVGIESDAWQHVETIVTAPAGYASASMDLWNWRDPSAGTFISYFDDAEFVSLPEADASALGIGVVAGLAWRSRRSAPEVAITSRRENRA